MWHPVLWKAVGQVVSRGTTSVFPNSWLGSSFLLLCVRLLKWFVTCPAACYLLLAKSLLSCMFLGLLPALWNVLSQFLNGHTGSVPGKLFHWSLASALCCEHNTKQTFPSHLEVDKCSMPWPLKKRRSKLGICSQSIKCIWSQNSSQFVPTLKGLEVLSPKCGILASLYLLKAIHAKEHSPVYSWLVRNME